MNIKKIVKNVIEQCNTNDPFKIANKLEIMIVFELLGDTLGYFTNTFRTPIIHINQTITYLKQMFVCCHELGHAILHPNHNASFLKNFTHYPNDHFESEANDFAIELLFFNSDTPITLDDMVHGYGIPKQLIINKMKTHNKEF